MKFFAVSAMAAVASATHHYGMNKFSTTGLSTGYSGLSNGYSGLSTGFSGLSNGYSTGLSGLSTGYGYNGMSTGYIAPAMQKVAYQVAQPTFAVQKVGLAHGNYAHAGLAHGNYAHAGLAHGNYASGFTYGQAAVAPLAVQSTHQVQYMDVPSGGQINPISVEVDASPVPMNLMFKSASSQLNVEQAHNGAQGSVQESQSEDEAHVLKHSVTKPVVQEVREVITPFRKINQEIMPVQESINTVVARGQYSAPTYAHGAQAVQTFARPAVHTVNVAAPAIHETVAVNAPLAGSYHTTNFAAPAFEFNKVNTFAHAPAFKAHSFEFNKDNTFVHAPAFKAQSFEHNKAKSFEFNKAKTFASNDAY